MSDTGKALGFTVMEACREGLLDDALPVLIAALQARARLRDPKAHRHLPRLPQGQVWVWLHDTPAPQPRPPGHPDRLENFTAEPGPGRWEPRGTGALL